MNAPLAPTITTAKMVVRAPRAADRVAFAARWLSSRPVAGRLVIVASSSAAAEALVHGALGCGAAAFGWHKVTLPRLSGELAARALADARRVPAGGLSFEAVASRVLFTSRGGKLGRFDAIADRPGLARALARTFAELREAGMSPADLGHDVDLARLFEAFVAELATLGLADRAEVLALATATARDASARHDLLDVPVLLHDVPLRSRRDAEVLLAVARRAPWVLATVPTGDAAALGGLEDLGPVIDLPSPCATSLGRLQRGLFSPSSGPREGASDDLVVFSAPGEGREAVEIARAVHREAERGVAFDRMAVVLRSPTQYRAHFEEAFRRAEVPVHFAHGVRRPDPSGRALLALLACAQEGLSARRFAEYLSLGELPDAEADGAPPGPVASSERFQPADDELVSRALAGSSEADPEVLEEGAARAVELDSSPVIAGSLRAPRLWERLLVDAAVIGGRDRWERRLDGLRNDLELARSQESRENPDGPRVQGLERDLAALSALRTYALPLLGELEPLASLAAPWGEWIERISALASRSLRDGERVQSVLAELCPMARTGPVTLSEVRLVLEERLNELVLPSAGRHGRVFVGSAEDARGLSFEVVFVPGLAERMFPQKLTEDPVLPDRERKGHPGVLATQAERAERERLALRIAVGAAERRLYVSYPRIDVDQSRPRTPSFYALEIVRAAEGVLPGFSELARGAEELGTLRLGWPAPAHASRAIDAAEHDLAVLDSILRRPEAETLGMARYLLSTNAHLARALRFRARRWIRSWNRADGLVDPIPEARAALAEQALSKRSFSPTALQQFAACPYRFFLHTIHRFARREDPAAIEELGPLERGSLVHETQFELLGELREAGLLPLRPEALGDARARLDRVLDRVAKRYEDDLAPAIDRIFRDSIDGVRADLREWLRRTSEEPEFVPAYFELSFGLDEQGEAKRDAHSTKEAVPLDCGIRVRGSIDLVERSRRSTLRATDHKTGKPRADDKTVIGGGETLQPVLYALVLEKLFAGERVESGRLYYCTSAAEFVDVTIPLDARAREGAELVAKTIGDALEKGFLPAAPAERVCEYCDYASVCGPYEQRRARHVKRQDLLKPLARLREAP